MTQMYTFMVIMFVVVFMMLMILIIGRNKRTQYITWGLGVECNCYYSSHFTVSKQDIKIIGYQEVIDRQSPIQYSVVKQKWWGETKVYGQAIVFGDYKSGNCFIVEISNIPLGEEYRIKIDSKCNIAKGKFQIITE